MTAQPIVGRIVLENEAGGTIAELKYVRHPLLRKPDVKYEGVWYWQNRQTLDGTWVYRSTGSVPASSPETDPQLVQLGVGE